MASTAHRKAGAQMPKYDKVLMIPSSHLPEYFVDTTPSTIPNTITSIAVIMASSRVAGR